MKKITLVLGFTLCLILSAVVVLNAGWWAVTISGSVNDEISSCDDCSGDLALAHHFEDTDCTIGTPCGCSDNTDKNLTLGSGASISNTTGTGWPSDGTHSLAFGTGETTIPLTWNKNRGTISFDVNCTDFNEYQTVLYIGDASGDYLRVSLLEDEDNNKVEFVIRHNWETAWTVTSAANAYTGGVSSITIKWDTTAHDGHYMALTVDGTTTYGDTLFTPVSGTYTQLNIESNASTNTCYIDNLKVYTAWQ